MFLWVRYPNIFFWVVNQKTLCAFSSKLVSCSVSGILLFRLAAVSAFSPPCFLKRPLAPFAAILNGTLARFYPEYQVDKLCTVRPLATWTALGVVTRPLVSGDFNHVDCVLCTALLCIIVNFAKCTSSWIVVNWAPFAGGWTVRWNWSFTGGGIVGVVTPSQYLWISSEDPEHHLTQKCAHLWSSKWNGRFSRKLFNIHFLKLHLFKPKKKEKNYHSKVFTLC